MDVYYRYSSHLKKKYGVKTYKLPVNLPLTCPNRDGLLGEEGCYFCDEEGAAFEFSALDLSIKEQLLRLKDYIGDRYNAEKFIAYFQNFTNTYLPLSELKNNVNQALQVEDIVEISFSTRPDCINTHYLHNLTNLINEQKPEVNLCLELGLQTVNYHTLKKCNRGHTLAEFIDAVITAHRNNVKVGVHLILNLPGDDMVDVKENARILSALRVDNVKLHALYIREGTQFAKLYKRGELEIIPLKEYKERVITFLEYLDDRIAVQRLLGRASDDKTLFVNWGQNWREIHNSIINMMKKRDSYQGKKCNYLQGKALAKFK